MCLDDWSGWTDWGLFDALNWTSVPTGPGTYMIVARRKLHRAVGVDDEGILDIGTSKRLAARLREFWQCANGKRRAGHMAGWLFAEYGMDVHFPLTSLFVCWREAPSEEEAALEEARKIDAYTRQHMESPPLNFSASWCHLRTEA